MEARNRLLPDWMTKIRTHQIELPRFQRLQAWGHREITDLLNAVARGLPVGSVLILEIGDEMPFISRALAGAPAKGERVTELLLDGQQRLTALWRALNDDYKERTYFAEFPDKNGEIDIISIARWHKNEKKYPMWADDPKQCWARQLAPIRLLRPGEEGEADLDKWVAEAVDNDPVADKALFRKIGKPRRSFANFNLPFLSLDVGTPKEIALEVFIKMNTRMVRLTTFDIIVAQTEEATGESLHDLVESLASTVPGLTAYETPEDIVLSVMALIQDRIPNQTGYLGLDFDRMVDDWPILVESALKAVTFLEEEMVFDDARLPTDTVLAPIIAIWSFVEDKPDITGNTKILLRKYLWRAFFTDRYERSVATYTLQDYRALKNVVLLGKSEREIPSFDEQEHPLPTIEAVMEARWPKRRDRLARAILQVSLRGGANDIADGSLVTRGHLRRREYHHLFPLGYLKEQGVEEYIGNRALNCALVSWKTNRAISAKEPLQYLQERAEASSLGEEEIRRRLATHGIDYDWLAKCDYQLFLTRRAELVINAVRALADGKPWKPDIS